MRTPTPLYALIPPGLVRTVSSQSGGQEVTIQVPILREDKQKAKPRKFMRGTRLCADAGLKLTDIHPGLRPWRRARPAPGQVSFVILLLASTSATRGTNPGNSASVKIA